MCILSGFSFSAIFTEFTDSWTQPFFAVYTSIGCMVCPRNSSYTFCRSKLSFCRMFIYVLKMCILSGFSFSAIFTEFTDSWTQPFFAVFTSIGCIVCPRNSSYIFRCSNMSFSRMFVWVLRKCILSGFSFSPIFTDFTDSWTLPFFVVFTTIGCTVCPRNSSYTFRCSKMSFCRMFICILKMCILSGFSFFPIFTDFTDSWTSPFFFLYSQLQGAQFVHATPPTFFNVARCRFVDCLHTY